MTDYQGNASSREKDLVDLVVFATTQDVAGTALRVAITTEARRRKMHCANYPTVDLAATLVAALIDPALAEDAEGRVWDHADRAWRSMSRTCSRSSTPARSSRDTCWSCRASIIKR